MFGVMQPMGYLKAVVYYLKAEKNKHDLIDYIRACIIMGSVMVMIQIYLDVLYSWQNP